MRAYFLHNLLKRISYDVPNCRNINYFWRCLYHPKFPRHYCSKVNSTSEPLKVKLDENTFKSILTPEVLVVKKLFEDYGHELRIVGGAVRDLLMGKTSDDLDLCTPATPDEMKEMYDKAGIRILTLSGVKHGTISIRVNDKQNFEVTTLRVDIRTDGRHAIVQFTKDWRLDALRRDLTINSLFLDFDGYVHDYFNGIEDVKRRKVRFVHDPDVRIQEDYLRILRYFRFYGRIAEHPNTHEDNILESIKRNADGLKRISGERIWVELRKIVLGRYPDSIMRTMFEIGVTQNIGFTDSIDIDKFSKVCKNTASNDPDAMTRMAALFRDNEQLQHFTSRIRLSNKEKNLCAMILEYRDKVDTNDMDSIKRHVCLNFTETRKQFQCQMAELCKYNGNTDMAYRVLDEDFPVCPVSPKMLSSFKRIRRKYAIDVMAYICTKWVDSGFILEEKELLNLVDEFIEEHRDKYENLLYPEFKKKVK